MAVKNDAARIVRLHRPSFDWGNIVFNILLPAAGVLLALLISAIVLLFGLCIAARVDSQR